MRRTAIFIGLCALTSWTAAADPVKHVGIYVQPYYESARSANEKPRVAVHKKYNELLSSNRQQDIIVARDMIQREPQLITPMTLMVLAIRLYDVGLRDDSVFWFYVAKDRFATLAEVLQIRSPSLAQVEQATRDFAILAGPVINGYAFCDVAKQKQLRAKAFEWVEKNTYQAIFIPQLPARSGDRNANLKNALEKLRSGVKSESEYLSQPANLTKLAKARKDIQADNKFCWKS